MAPVVARSQKSIKKDGAGGSYTWGRALDCQEHYYEPVGVDSAGVGLTIAPPVAPAVERTQVATTFDSCIDDAAEFPSLGSAAAPSLKASVSKQSSSKTTASSATSASSTPSTTPSTSTRTPPSTPPPPAPQLAEACIAAAETEAAVATTKETLVIAASTATLPVREKQAEFDARHPRSSFAKIPKKAATETQSPAIAIDWSAEGAPPSMQQAAYKSLPNPAHLGPFAERPTTTEKNQVPLAVLRTQQPLVQQHFAMVNNKGLAKKPHQQLARPKIAQPRKR